MGHSRDQPKTSWGCRVPVSPPTLSWSIFMKLTDYLGDKPFWKVTVRLAVPGRAAKRSDKLVPARRYAHGLAPRRRDALCRWYGGAVGLDGGALELWPVLGHERFYLAILGYSEPQGHSPRHGTWPSDGDFYFDGFFRCGILRAGVGAGTIQQRPCRRGCGLPVFAHRVLFLSGGCLDVSFVERSARHGAGEAAALCFHRHDDRQTRLRITA